MRVHIFLVILAIFTNGCIPKYIDKQPTELKTVDKAEIVKPKEISKSYKVTMKTKKFAFADTGFLVNSDDMIRLNVLAMGKSVLDLKVKNSDDICVGSLCNTKLGFNQSFLSRDYPEDLIENVLKSKPIFDGKNLIKTASGFIQKIETPKYKIKYQISHENIYFKDSKNKIIMKLKELKE